MVMKYKVVLRHSDEGVSVSVPGLPGCWSQGATEAEALENVQVAVKEYLSAVDEQTEGGEVREIEIPV
jgi:predicted RNase H-like HicB family nuclease